MEQIFGASTACKRTKMCCVTIKITYVTVEGTLKIYPSPVYQVLNVNWSAFLKGIFPPSRVTAGTMGPMESANWTMGTCICSHWLCGPLVCYWPLCGRHGCSWVSQTVFFPPPTPPTPFRRTPPHPAVHPTHPLYYQY